jgi:uncharacterized protein YbjT (DUF2867 family)
MNDTILVTMATGKQGRAVTRKLLAQGQKVRAFVRDPGKAEDLKKMGAEIVQGNLLDRDSIERSLKGIKRMFLAATPYESGGVEEEIRQGMNGVEAAHAAGVEYLFYSSVGSAHRNTDVPHFESKWKIENRIRELGFTRTILRAVFFMDNFGSPWILPGMQQQGMVTMPFDGNTRLAMVAVETVADYIVAAFMNPEKFIGREIELGAEELTMNEAVDKISRASGKRIEYRAFPKENAEKAFGTDLTKMYQWFEDVGYNPDFNALNREYGIHLITFDEYLHAAPWVGELKKVPAEKRR